jgi:hypothetical protein
LGLVAPLINIEKIPDRLTPFPFGGGDVVYAYTVTNPGIIAMNNILVTDDKCSPVNYLSGDINNDTYLNPSETWHYSCETKILTSTKNTAMVRGSANGLTAVDYAFATVLVLAPGLPSAGLTPLDKIFPWGVVASSLLILLSAISISIVFKKHKT